MRSVLIFNLILKGQNLLHSKRNSYYYMDIAAFWDVTSCSLIAIHTHFGGTCWLHLLNTGKSLPQHIPKDSVFHSHQHVRTLHGLNMET